MVCLKCLTCIYSWYTLCHVNTVAALHNLFLAMLTRRRCCQRRCQRAGVLILVALLASTVLLYEKESAEEVFILTDYDLNKQQKNVIIDYLNEQKKNQLSNGKFASEQHQKEQVLDHIVKVYQVMGKRSFIAKRNAITAFPARIKVRAPSTSQLLRRFPKYMIIGFGKAGTKAVLKLHPSLKGPETEQRYFSRYYSQGLSSYLVHLPDPHLVGLRSRKVQTTSLFLMYTGGYLTHPK